MSKRIVALVGIIILSAGLKGLSSAPQQDNPAVLLRAAIETEEVDGDLNAAIEQYKHVIKIAGTDRAVAAQALLRLGGCYEKRGPEEARQAYQQLIRDYAEQTREVAAARQRLALLGSGLPARARASRLSIRRVPDLDMFAKPSPDGKYLAFTDWKTGNLAVLDIATGSTRPLTQGASFGVPGGYAAFAAWSGDSRRIAYQWEVTEPKESRTELRVLSLGADAPPDIITIPGARWAEPLGWAPDGRRVLCRYATGRTISGLVLAGTGVGAVQKLDVPARGWLYHFTRDGDALLYSLPGDGKAGANDIFVHDLQTGVTTPVIQHPGEDLLVGLLPGTDWLVFVSDRRGALDLWAVPFRHRTAGGEPVLVKQGLGRFYPLGFSSEGHFYYATLSATDDVFMADYDRDSGTIRGEARKFATRWDGVSGFPSFSPDGGTLAYVAKLGLSPVPVHGTDTLLLQSLQNPAAGPKVVSFQESGHDRIAGPCWAADGTAVVVAGFGGYQQAGSLYRVDLPGLQTTKIYTVPDGRQLISHACAGGGPLVYAGLAIPGVVSGDQPGGVVVEMDAVGGQQREVFRTAPGHGLYGFSLSPDGHTLSVVTSLDRQRRNLLVVRAQDGASRQILEFREPSGGGVTSEWTTDGRSVLYIQMSDTWKDDHTFLLQSVRVDGGPAVPRTVFRWPGQFFWFKFHPNGRLVAFHGRPNVSTSSEVWVMENLREEIRLLTTPGKRP